MIRKFESEPSLSCTRYNIRPHASGCAPSVVFAAVFRRYRHKHNVGLSRIKNGRSRLLSAGTGPGARPSYFCVPSRAVRLTRKCWCFSKNRTRKCWSCRIMAISVYYQSCLHAGPITKRAIAKSVQNVGLDAGSGFNIFTRVFVWGFWPYNL